MPGKTFYEDGLRFECTRCSKCCRHTPGYVFLSEEDIGPLLSALNLSRHDFLRLYCRHVRIGPAHRLSLKEKPNVDCILWEGGGCSVYAARPLQCRSFPFWSSCLSSADEWELHARQCPGMGKGRLHSREEIEGWLAQRLREPFIEVGG
jgi:Fe-S-cluster containining protein